MTLGETDICQSDTTAGQKFWVVFLLLGEIRSGWLVDEVKNRAVSGDTFIMSAISKNRLGGKMATKRMVWWYSYSGIFQNNWNVCCLVWKTMLSCGYGLVSQM